MKKIGIEGFYSLHQHQILNKELLNETDFTDITEYRVAAYQNICNDISHYGVFELFQGENFSLLPQLLLDLTCYVERNEKNKVQWIEKCLNNKDLESIIYALPILRWIPNQDVHLEMEIEDLQILFDTNLVKLGIMLDTLFHSDQNTVEKDEILLWNQSLLGLTQRFDLSVETVSFRSVNLSIPKEFIKDFQFKKRKGLVSIHNFASELVKYLLTNLLSKTTAFTVEDSYFSQIANVEDLSSHNRDEIPIDLLLDAMKDNISASTKVWKAVLSERKNIQLDQYL